MAKEKKTRAPKEPRAKQEFLDGMAPPSIPEIDRAADAYAEARDERMALAEVEAEKKALLDAVMKKNNLKTYSYDEKIVSYEENLSVRKKKKEKEPKE